MRYGAFRYGDGTKYGEAVNESQLWALFIDWDGKGLTNQPSEAARMTMLKTTRGRQYLLNSNGNGFEMVDIGRLSIELDNSDGRFHPFNKKSPLYPNVRPGVKINIKTRLPITGQIFDVFTGQIDDIVPVSADYERVKISAVDGMKWLDAQNVVLHIFGSQTLSANITTTLTEAAWPWGINVESSTDVVPWFWSPSWMSARSLLHDLASSYLGMFFVAANGDAKFYNRYHDLTPAKMRLTQDQLSTDLMTRTPWEVIKNKITIIGHPRTGAATTVLWSLNDKPSIPAGSTFEVWGTYSVNGAEVPITGFTGPLATTDWLVNSAQNGSGTDLTASCTLTRTVYANKINIKITNNSGTLGYITKLQLRGDPLLEGLASIDLTDQAGVGLYGPKTLSINSLFLQNSNLISDLANALLALLKDPQIYPTIKVITRPEIQYTVDLFDNLDLVIDKFGLADTYRIGRIEHEWLSDTGQASVTTLELEPVNNSLATIWRFTTQIGIDSIFSF